MCQSCYASPNRIFLPAATCRRESEVVGTEKYGYYYITLDESDSRQAYMMNFGVEKGRAYKITKVFDLLDAVYIQFVHKNVQPLRLHKLRSQGVVCH